MKPRSQNTYRFQLNRIPHDVNPTSSCHSTYSGWLKTM
jgi:hypothetical protein